MPPNCSGETRTPAFADRVRYIPSFVEGRGTGFHKELIFSWRSGCISLQNNDLLYASHLDTPAVSQSEALGDHSMVTDAKEYKRRVIAIGKSHFHKDPY